MYKYSIDSVESLTPNVLSRVIADFTATRLPYIRKCQKYYDGKQNIDLKELADSTRPNHRVVNNFCQTITECFAGYIAGEPITYSSNEDIQEFIDVLNYNDAGWEDSTILTDALKTGIGAEVYFVDKYGKQRFLPLSPEEVIPIYSNHLDKELVAVIRIGKKNNWDDSYTHFVDVYTDRDIRHYTTDELHTHFSLQSVEPHYYHQVPVNIAEINNNNVSVFDVVLSLQDIYNRMLSDESDAFEAWSDAYLAIYGATADAEDIAQMKKNRVLMLNTDCRAEFLTKKSSDTNVEDMLNRIEDNIWLFSRCPNFTSESFGTASGVALKMRLLPFIERAGTIAQFFKKFLQKRCELIFEILNLTSDDAYWRDVEINFNYNLPVDETAEANLISSYRGLVSDETLLSQISFVKNVDEEKEKVREEYDERMALYDFGGNE